MGKSSSASKQQQVSATDEAVIQSGKQTTAARDSSFAVGAGASYTESGSLQLGKGAKLEQGNISAGEGSTVILGTPSGELSDLIGKFTDAAAAQADALAGIVAGQQAQIGTLAENKQTDGDQTKDKTLAIVAGGALALVAVIALKGK